MLGFRTKIVRPGISVVFGWNQTFKGLGGFTHFGFCVVSEIHRISNVVIFSVDFHAEYVYHCTFFNSVFRRPNCVRKELSVSSQ